MLDIARRPGGSAFQHLCIEMESIRCDAQRVTRRLLDNSPHAVKASWLQDAIENVCGTFPLSLGHGEFPLLFSVLTTLVVSVLKNKKPSLKKRTGRSKGDLDGT